MMALVFCEVSEGLRASEATVAVRSFDDDQQFLRIERDFLVVAAGQSYLTVGLIQKDRAGKFALIELPHEADSGTSRLWISVDQLLLPLVQECVA